MGKKARRYSPNATQQTDNVVSLNYHDQQARLHGPKKKNWSIHDLHNVTPLTEKQEDMFHAWFQGDDICAHGSAGTGKSFLSLFLACSEMLDRGEHDRIIIIRSAVQGRDMGHLPGSLEEKYAEYEAPYQAILSDLFGRKSTYADMKEAGKIEFMTTSFIRGLTFDNAIIILDEFQNCTFAEIDSVMTRVGKNSRVLVAGDDKRQCDLRHHEETGSNRMISAFKKMGEFSTIEFNTEDVVRSAYAKSWLLATGQA